MSMTGRSTPDGAIPGETYFFRDHGQFDVVRTQLLPALMESRAAARRLRLWSAGCATGEEAYSLAIIVRELGLLGAGWQVTIVGTDVDDDALAAAREAVYGAWSFRMVAPAIRARYFSRLGGEWALDPQIRGMVRFHHHDLRHDALPPPSMAPDAADLVLCRNLFIYFPREVVSGLVTRVTQALTPGGFLVTAHGEIHGCTDPGLETVPFPESIVYRRAQRSHPGPSAGGSHGRLAPNRLRRPGTDSWLASAMTTMADGDADAPSAGAGADDDAPERGGGRAPLTRPRADTYYLLARVARERGDRAAAYDDLRKAIYLDPSFVPAYVDLATLCAADGHASRARSLRTTALACLDRLAPDALIPPTDHTAAELRMRIAAVLE